MNIAKHNIIIKISNDTNINIASNIMNIYILI